MSIDTYGIQMVKNKRIKYKSSRVNKSRGINVEPKVSSKQNLPPLCSPGTFIYLPAVGHLSAAQFSAAKTKRET